MSALYFYLFINFFFCKIGVHGDHKRDKKKGVICLRMVEFVDRDQW